ncbi:hypothetical protein ABT008_22280 [Micromonospora sp. NPDC002389]|uniref:hypothetical protein n=1 Tax=Micromonospora sp. NPDC002389 TaxID=3154272 RepID=UPI003330DA70
MSRLEQSVVAQSGRCAFWYHVILALVCAGGGILLFSLGYRTYPVVALVGATAWLGMAVRSARDTETAGSDVEEGGRNTMQGRKALTLVISILIAVGATLLLANANGNITAYIVGGALLAIVLYVIVSVMVNWKKAV